MKKLFYTLPFLLASLLFFSCNNFEEGQEIPSYIEVEGFNLVENPTFSFEQNDGFLTNNITDVWVYVDQKYIGAYSLPKNGQNLIIPILKEGEHTIDLQPGIKYNGMSATREYYRFYTYHTERINLEPGICKKISKKDVMYNTDADIEFYYSFDDGLNHFENPPLTAEGTPNNFSIINNDSVEYGNCLAMYSASSKDDYKIITIDSIECSNTNAMILELDYHSNIPFEVGIYGKISKTSNTHVYLSSMRMLANNNSGWNKMYIILGKVWSQISYQPFRIYFQPFNTENIPNGYIHIDNIKVVHYQD